MEKINHAYLETLFEKVRVIRKNGETVSGRDNSELTCFLHISIPLCSVVLLFIIHIQAYIVMMTDESPGESLRGAHPDQMHILVCTISSNHMEYIVSIHIHTTCTVLC